MSQYWKAQHEAILSCQTSWDDPGIENIFDKSLIINTMHMHYIYMVTSYRVCWIMLTLIISIWEIYMPLVL